MVLFQTCYIKNIQLAIYKKTPNSFVFNYIGCCISGWSSQLMSSPRLLATCLPPSPFHETLYLCLADRINICICSSRDPTARCDRSSSSSRSSSVFLGFTENTIENKHGVQKYRQWPGTAGRECRTFLSIPANILGDSVLNVITGGNNSLPCSKGSRWLTAGMDSNAPKFSLLLWESR